VLPCVIQALWAVAAHRILGPIVRQCLSFVTSYGTNCMGYVVLSLQNASELCRRRPGIARLLLWLTNPVPKLRCLEVYRGVRSPVVAAQYLSGTE